MRVACSTWPGGGNVAVFRALADQLRARGHEVTLECAWPMPAPPDGDVLLLDHMAGVDDIEAAMATGRPVAAVVHTLWSFVPSLEGTWAPPGYLDALASLDRLLVFTARELDGSATVPANLRFVGPAIEPEGPDAGWQPPDRSLVVVSMGTTDMGEAPVLQRVLDALATAPVDVVVTVGSHIDAEALHVPANARVTGFVRHAALLPHADVFVGHGGHGGIMAALAFGVPIVTLPLDRDQPHNAARVEAVGAGRTVDKDADPTTIREAVEAVRTGERERIGAIRMANAIAEHRDAAVREVEALAG
jgi:MGT family glycosyltransferase